MILQSPLSGRIALISGGGRGIGLATAQLLAQAGAKVWITGRSESAITHAAAVMAEELGADVRSATLDLTNLESVASLVEEITAAHTQLDILVNNAGSAESAPFDTQDESLWARMINVNLTGVFRLTQAMMPLLRRTKSSGRIVNIASTAGLTGYPYVTAYCAAKHGVIGMTRALAAELARDNITVNAICPGYTETDLVDKAVATISDRTSLSEAQARAALIRDVPIGRYIRPEEVAAAVLWICGEDAAGVTGAAIPVAGGAVN